MIPEKETSLESEGGQSRLKDLLSNYQTAKTKRDPERLKATTLFVLDTGEELLKLKKQLAPGSFLQSVRHMGIAKSAAQDYMRAFKKFGACRETVYNLGAGKLYVLMYLKDKDIKTLTEGGKISGITLADIDGMTVREVKNILVKRRKLPRPTWHKRVSIFKKHIKLAFSALAGVSK